MQEQEQLLATALGYLKAASETQDFAVRAKLLELAYRCQQLAQATILPDGEPPDKDGSFAPAPSSTNLKLGV